jgi:hypothetical protein
VANPETNAMTVLRRMESSSSAAGDGRRARGTNAVQSVTDTERTT